MGKAAEAFRTISEVADDLGIQKHVLRFWEVKFTQIRPMKRGGGRRYYRPEDMELLRGIRQLLHRDGYTIKGVQKILREQGVEAVKEKAREGQIAAEAGVSARAAAAVAAGAEPAAETAMPSLARSKPRGAGKLPQGAQRSLIAAVIAELGRCRELLGGGPLKGAGSAKPERRARRSA